MSPQDKVERVLKEMHVMFSKSLEVGGMPDKMVVDRGEYMNLLDQLTTGIYEMMEEYEQTRQSRMAAERSFQRNAEEIIDQANASAEDVYAASMLYTADTIGKIRALMDQTNDSMNDMFIQFRRELREQKDILRAHESELQAQLADMSDTRKYLSVLRDINREQERKNRDLEAEREIGNQYARNLFRTAVSPVEEKMGPGPAANDAKEPVVVSGDKPEITVNKNAAYFKWKEGQDGEPTEDTEAAEAGAQPEEGDGLQIIGMGSADTANANGAGAEAAGQNGQDGSRSVNPVQQPKEDEDQKFPHEDDIYRQVLEDEREREAEENDTGQMGAGEVLKTLIFGRDLE